MPDIIAAQAAFSSLATALDMARGLASIRDAVKMNTAVLDLQRSILEAQQFAMQAQSTHLTMERRISELEEEISRMKKWDAGKEEYRLEKVSHGAFAYVSQPAADSGTPEVWCCVNCFEGGHRSVLQQKDLGQKARGIDNKIFACPRCRSEISTHYSHSPGQWRKENPAAER
jgi:hypothetical protein